MAHNSVWLTLHVPTITVRLTPELQKLWQDIQFHEESGQYEQYDAAWNAFLDKAHYDIMDQIADDYNVTDAGEVRGA